MQAALEASPADRALLLDEVCAGDLSLRAEVESLLAYDGPSKDLLDTAAFANTAKMRSEGEAEPMEGRLVGPYKIIRRIGYGGMGTVFLAARADDQYRKRVAIKLVRRGMDTEFILSRFLHERQILASLDHQNIARLLDGGTTEDGLPYFVMEYIEGLTIDRYCDAHKLSTVERLKLFRSICAAVHFAHQNLVVHRDIKPSNILVTSEGVPKLLDFGIAKLLNPELYAQTIVPTAIQLRLMTPDYASPEQVRGQAITTATDTYSLGVLLYELLTGHRPYRLASSLPQEIERIICEQEPDKPSTAINRRVDTVSSDGTNRISLSPEIVSQTREGQPEKLRRKLAGDLDNIILMAMRKEPHRRYASVEQFSEDIRRHLEGLPVIARKDAFAYRAGKFIKRNKVAVVVTAIVAMLVASSVIAIIIQSSRAARERDKARQVSGFLVDLFKVSDPGEARGRTITAREILDHGAERIQTELKDQPEVQATLMNTIGQVYESLGLYDSAAAILEKALSIRRELFGRDHPDVAESMTNLGQVLYDKSDFAAAEPLYREGLEIRRKIFGREHAKVAESLNGLGTLLDAKGEDEEAEALWREALAMRRKLFGGEHRDVAESQDNLGWMLYQKGEYEESERLLREALATHKKVYGDDHPMIAADLNYLAFVAGKTGKADEEEKLYREALAIRQRVFGPEHPQVAESLNNLAWMLNQRGKTDEAEALYREALAIRRKMFGGQTQEVAQGLSNLARVLMQRGRYDEAEPMLREALASYRKIGGEKHPDTARGIHNLAVLLYEKGDHAGAESYFRQALELRRERSPKGNLEIAATLLGLGQLLSERGNPHEAEPMLREAVEIRRRDLPGGHYQVADAESVLGGCLVALKRYDEAEPLLIDSYPILKAKRGEQAKETMRAIARVIKLYTAWGKPDKASQFRAGL